MQVEAEKTRDALKVDGEKTRDALQLLQESIINQPQVFWPRCLKLGVEAG